MKTVTIHNATRRMVLIPCNSGRSLFLAPRGQSDEIPESEIRPNARVDKLEGRKAIVVHPAAPAKKASKPRTKRASSPRRAKKEQPAKAKA